MAKRGVLTHRKTRRLAKTLGCEVPHALGLMEALWHVAADRTPRGDIGTLTDQDIADEMFYTGDAAALVAAFLEVGILDADETYRLTVHGWSEHTDDTTRKKLEYNGWKFVDGEPPRRRPGESPKPRRDAARASKPVEPSREVLELSREKVREDSTDSNDTSPRVRALPEPEPEPEPVPDSTLPPRRPPAPAASGGDGATATMTKPTKPRGRTLPTDEGRDEPSRFSFPVIANDGREWVLSAAQLAEYKRVFGDVIDVEKSLECALLHVRGDPRERKTPGGMWRFLQTWLKGDVNRGNWRLRADGEKRENPAKIKWELRKP